MNDEAVAVDFGQYPCIVSSKSDLNWLYEPPKNMHSLNLSVHADNYAGISCYKKVGFREGGRLPEVFFVNGKYVDKIYMAILQDEFDE